MTGVLMISLALVADAVIGNVQEKTIKQYNASNSEVADIMNSSRSLLLSLSSFRLCCSATVLDSSTYFSWWPSSQTLPRPSITARTILNKRMDMPLYFPSPDTLEYRLHRLPNYSVKMGDLFRLFSASSDNLELSWQSLSQPSGRQSVLFSPSSSSPSPSHSIMFTGKILISTFVDIQGRNFYFPNFSGLLVLIGIYLSLYSKNKDSNSVAVFNNMFKKIKRLLFVPKFHTGKHSYNI